MEIKLDSGVIRKLSARGILNYVAMSLCSKGNQATPAELARAIGLDPETLALRRDTDIRILQNLDLSAKKKPRKKAEVKPFVLPDWIPQDVWEGFVEGRRRKHGAPTVYASHQIVKKLEAFRAEGEDPIEILNQSAMAGWSGVFRLRQEFAGAPPRSHHIQATEFKL